MYIDIFIVIFMFIYICIMYVYVFIYIICMLRINDTDFSFCFSVFHDIISHSLKFCSLTAWVGTLHQGISGTPSHWTPRCLLIVRL